MIKNNYRSHWKLKKLGFRLIGIIVFIIILTKIDYNKVSNIFRSSKPTILLLSLIFPFIQLITQSKCWESLINIQNINKWGFWKTFKVFLIGQFYGIITPGKIGDVIRIFYMKRDLNINNTQGLTNLILHRVINISTLILFAIFFSFVFLKFQIYLLIISIFFALILLVFILSINIKFKTFIHGKFKKITDKILPKSLKVNGSDFWKTVTIFKTKKIYIPVVFSIVTYLFMILQAKFILLSLNTDIPLISLIFYFSVAQLSVILPISISGIGIREALYIYFFNSINISSEVAISFSVIMTIINYVITALIGLWFQNRDPVPLKSEKLNLEE